MADFEKLSNSVIKGNVEEVTELTQTAIDEGAEPTDIIKKGLIGGMKVVGQRFKDGDMFVPEVMMAAKSMKAGVELVNPLLAEGDTSSEGKVLLGTVAGDLHDIGKNLVGMMMESASLEVIDLGTDVDPEEFVEAVKEHQPDVVGMSALLTTTMLEMQNTIELLEEEGLRDSVKIIVGGAPVTPDFAEEIGADGWSADAASAKDKALELIG
ncbi:MULTISPECIES: corrinoid protein [unclassified Candidatus Frackibacter]|uniref:corrinoid protein n=1 Tax=unclassified Candidatus Frackibacter TaxID=2648818 RepID=UPI0008C6CFF1|nr:MULTISPECIES: corrinoid protein [unclassified Candidatus Frackibacter]SEM62982.1 B12 binding domain-containing protein [Candidatus Frackibacter sp. WG12]SFL64743.1 B12 binding domain-containing protein [Candidatus Frackibacter sp. WG13]